MLQIALFRPLLIAILLKITVSTVCNIRDYGAVGDGATDDSTAIIETISKCMNHGGLLYIPTGTFLIDSQLVFKIPNQYTIAGDGLSSVLLWNFDDHLIYITSEETSSEVAEITIRDLKITSVITNKSLDRFAIYAEKLVRSYISHLLINSNDTSRAPVPGGIGMIGVADTNTIRDVIMWEIHGTGIQIGYGSEIRILGGRITGANNRFDQSIGIHCTGNNGGVHIENTDIIGLATGVLVANTSGAGSNREIFITHATIDSNGQGLIIRDNSYVSIVGVWAASNTKHQIMIDYNTSALLTVNGGTIFNGGVYECPEQTGWCNGITVHSGSIILTGVQIRFNKGRGVWITDASVTKFQITSCHIFSNGQGLNITGSSFVLTDNICHSNQYPNFINKTDSSIVKNNLDC